MSLRTTLLVVFPLLACPPPSQSDGGAPDGGGTSDGGAVGPLWRSGTRLKAQTIRTTDATVFEWFLDTQRSSEACYFRQTPGGTWRCVPQGAQLVYSDDQCMSPLALLDNCTAPFKYASREQFDACGATFSVVALHVIGAALPPATYYLRQGDGQCSMGSLASNQVLHAVAPALSFDEFVGTTESTESFGGLRRTRLHGSDGSELALRETLANATTGERCHPFTLSPTDERCVPSLTAFSGPGDFGDATCMQRAGRVSAPSCPLPTVAEALDLRDGGAAGCGSGYDHTLWNVGAVLDGGFFGGATCAPRGGFYLPLTTPLATASLPVTPTSDTGSGRLHLRAMSAAGVQLEPGYLHDTTVNDACDAQPFSDGKLYCVPPRVFGAPRHFKDAACMEQVVLSTACGFSATIALTGNLDCLGGTFDAQLRPLGPPFALAQYYEDAVGPCSPVTNSYGYARDLLPAKAVSTHLVEVTRGVE